MMNKPLEFISSDEVPSAKLLILRIFLLFSTLFYNLIFLFSGPISFLSREVNV